MASHTDVSNIRPSKIEPLHREVPAVGSGHVETSTRPEPGPVQRILVGLKWGALAYSALTAVTFISGIGLALQTHTYNGAAGIQIIVSVFVICLSLLAGVWAGKGRPAWQYPALAVIVLGAVSVLLLFAATRGDVANRMGTARFAALALATLGVAIAAVTAALVRKQERRDVGTPEANPPGGRIAPTILIALAIGAIAQGLIATGWLMAVRAIAG